MSQHRCLIALVLVPAALAALGSRRAGWLDRVVLYHKQKLFNELRELAPIKISAEIQQKPVGYVDSTQWDYDSVQRLLTLISASDTAKPVYKALRRMLQPTRRLMMSIKESKHRFPSIKSENNEFYYDGYSSAEEHELPAPPPVPEDQVVLVVSNPVEARLPSARISVKLLREIMEARARAARQMPTTKDKPWKEFIKNRTLFSSTTELAATQAANTTTAKPDSEDNQDTASTEPEDNVSTDPEDPASNKTEDTDPTKSDDPGTDTTEDSFTGTTEDTGTNTTEDTVSDITEDAATDATEDAATEATDETPP